MKSCVYRIIAIAIITFSPLTGESQTTKEKELQKSISSKRVVVFVNNDEGVLQISLLKTETSTGLLTFYNSEGLLIKSESVKLFNGNSVFYNELKEFKTGTYNFTIQLERESFTASFSI